MRRPGRVRGRAIELLVDAIAHTADGLCQEQPGGKNAEPAEQLQVVAARVDSCRENTADHRAVDAQSPEPPMPEGNDVEWVLTKGPS
jgi:hypothetical protein